MEEQRSAVQRAALALLAMQRHSWEQGVTMQAFLERGELEVVAPLAREAVYRAMPDGRAATIGVTDGVTDPCAVGEALLAACKLTGDATLRAGYDALLHWALHAAPRNAEGVLYHLTTSGQFWVDSLYMLPPFLAAAGYPDEALTAFYVYWDRLYDAPARLMRHQWDEENKRFIRPLHWGVGNGWALAACARMLRLLPAEREADRQKIAAMGTELIEGVLAHKRRDGLFHDVVDDAATFVETNLSQQLAYTLYRGMQDGWLPAARLAAADELRAGVHQKLDAWGFVQDVCGAPTFDKPGLSPEGQAFFLLMEQARDDYMKKEQNHG